MTNESSRRGLVWASWALMLAPLMLLLIFLALIGHAWIGLGHWPNPSAEDYQTAFFHAHQKAVIWFGYFTIWGAIPLWLVLICIQRFRAWWSWKLAVVQALTCVVGWVVIAVFANWNPGGSLNWYLD